jgi:hypothetical protein
LKVWLLCHGTIADHRLLWEGTTFKNVMLRFHMMAPPTVGFSAFHSTEIIRRASSHAESRLLSPLLVIISS